MRLEALAQARSAGRHGDGAYVSVAYCRTADGWLELDPTPMWRRLLDDLAAARLAHASRSAFHAGLARGARRGCRTLAETVAECAVRDRCAVRRLLPESHPVRERRRPQFASADSPCSVTRRFPPMTAGFARPGGDRGGAVCSTVYTNRRTKGTSPCVSAFQAASSNR